MFNYVKYVRLTVCVCVCLSVVVATTYEQLNQVVVVILFPTEYKQCITVYMNNNIKNKTT